MKIATEQFRLRASNAGIVLVALFGSVASTEISGTFSNLRGRALDPVELDWSQQTLDFTDFENGDYIFDELWDTQCVKVTAVANGAMGFTPVGGVHMPSGGAARVFDTGIENNCDEELEVNVGKVLIIQKASEEPICPAANEMGGSIIFDFCQPVVIQTATLWIRGNTRILFGSATQSTTRQTLINRDGFFTKTYNQDNTTKLEVSLAYKTSVMSLTYLQGIAPSSSRLDVTDPCFPNPCSNGGTCQSSQNPPGFTCSCLPTYAGPLCKCFDGSQLNATQLINLCNALPVGQKCCQTLGNTPACFDDTNGIVCPGSCSRNNACKSMSGYADENSCFGQGSCRNMKGYAGVSSCIGTRACRSFEGQATENNCTTAKDC